MARRSRPGWISDAVDGRVLTSDEVDGGWLVLGTGSLSLRHPDGEAVWHRPWTDVERGEWDGDAHALTVHWIGGGADRLVTVGESPRDLPLAFRERVDASIVHTESAPASGGGTLRVIVRRDADGGLFTQAIGVGRVRPGAALDRQIDALESRARDAVGL